jgi:hypothetical protein
MEADRRPHLGMARREREHGGVGRGVAPDGDDSRDAGRAGAGEDGGDVAERRVGEVAVDVEERQAGRAVRRRQPARRQPPATVMRAIFRVGAAV